MTTPAGRSGGHGTARIAREEIYDGRVVRLSKDTVRFPDGSVGALELVRHPGAAAVLPFFESPLDPDPPILLLRQYRYAAGGVLYEVPAGVPDSREEPWEECASRELLEETGYEAGELRYLTAIFTTPGFTDEVVHIFGAAELRQRVGRRDPDEFIEVVTLPLSEAHRRVGAGEIVDAKSVVALLFAACFLAAAWEEGRPVPAR